jgi:hypothetical protein
MDELLALLERYSPGYHARIQGLYDWCLEDLEEVFGRQLPEFCKAFLRTMGTQAGPLLAGVVQHDILHITSLYRSTSLELPPRRYLLLFGDPDPLAPCPYWLDLEASSEEGDSRVVRMPFRADAWKDKLPQEFFSLREMLFLRAMDEVCLPAFRHQVRYLRGAGQKTSKAEELARILESMGFVRLPYPRHSGLFERDGGGAVRLYRHPERPDFTVRAGMHSLEALKQFQALIEDNTDLEESRL